MSRFKPSSTSWAASPVASPGISPTPPLPTNPLRRSAKPTNLTPNPPAATPAAPPSARAKAIDFNWKADVFNPLREHGYLFALAFLFTRFSMVNQLIEFKLGLTTFMTYIFGVPALVMMFATGGLQRVLRSTASLLFIGFMLWMVFVIPFSVWKGGSVKLVKDSFLVEFPLLFLVAGLAVTRKNIEYMFKVIAASVSLITLSAFVFPVTWGDRLALAYGTVANPNDLATHLLSTLPFVAWAFLSEKSTFSFMKFFWLLTAVGAMVVVLRTGSRGGFLSFGVMLLIALLKVSSVQRVIILATTLLVTLATFALAPGVLIQRYLSIFTDSTSVEYLDDKQSVEARGSSEARKNLLKASLRITLANPLFGVGPGQFSVAEDDEQKRQGRSRGAWQVTHNSYTEVSSEMGIPGVLLFIGCMAASVLSMHRLSSARQPNPELRLFAITLMLSMVAFGICVFFASLAYRFYLPTFIGLTTVVIRWATSPEAAVNRTRAA